jgi:hypothetical protein
MFHKVARQSSNEIQIQGNGSDDHGNNAQDSMGGGALRCKIEKEMQINK